MPRLPRIDPPGGWHHIVNRGARHRDIFLDDEDRRLFLYVLGDSAGRHDAEVASYCEMGNHFHVVVYLHNGGISKFVHDFWFRYGRAFNDAHGFDGQLCKGRFEPNHIDTDEQLLATTRYVERNPLELGYDIVTYPWSSYAATIGKAARPKWLNPQLPIELAGGRSRYTEFVQTDQPQDKFGIDAGTKAWVPRPREYVQAIPIWQIETVAGATFADCWPGKTSARSVALALAVESEAYSHAELLRYFDFPTAGSVRSARYRLKKVREQDPRFEARYYELRAIIDGSIVAIAG